MDAITSQTVLNLDDDCVPYDADLEEEYWIAEYDEAMANDDGYRISAKDLRAKYGI